MCATFKKTELNLVRMQHPNVHKIAKNTIFLR